VVLVAREGDEAAGREKQRAGRQKHGRNRFILSNPTKIVGSESRATFHASAQQQVEYARSAERVSKSCVF
jgi:hypothetical protein